MFSSYAHTPDIGGIVAAAMNAQSFPKRLGQNRRKINIKDRRNSNTNLADLYPKTSRR